MTYSIPSSQSPWENSSSYGSASSPERTTDDRHTPTTHRIHPHDARRRILGRTPNDHSRKRQSPRQPTLRPNQRLGRTKGQPMNDHPQIYPLGYNDRVAKL